MAAITRRAKKTQCPLQRHVSPQPHNQVRTPALLLLSSACLWVSLATSWSLSFLIRTVGSRPPSHRTLQAPRRPALCSVARRGRQRPPSRLREPDAARLGQTRLHSSPIGSIRSGSAIFGDTGLCSASKALFGSVRFCSAPLGAGLLEGPAPARRVLPPRCACRFPDAGRIRSRAASRLCPRGRVGVS